LRAASRRNQFLAERLKNESKEVLSQVMKARREAGEGGAGGATKDILDSTLTELERFEAAKEMRT
jgi:hypothetical protein